MNQNADALSRMPHDVKDVVPMTTKGEVSRTFNSVAKSTHVPTPLVSALEEAFAQDGIAAGDSGQPSCRPFPLYSRAEVQSMKQQDPIIRQFLIYWDADKKLDAKDRRTENRKP